MRERQNRTPFKFPLVPLGKNRKYSELRQFAYGSDKIVRLGWERDLPAFKVGREGFRELEEHYGIFNSGVDIVVGENHFGMSETFIVTDKIYGQDLAKALHHNPGNDLLAEAGKLAQNLAAYYIDKGISGGDFWYDLALRQFMYGHKKDGEDKIYLVDVDPIFRNYDAEHVSGWETADYLKVFEELGRFTCEMQGIQKGITFGNMGERVRSHLSIIPLSYQFRHRVEDIKHYFD